MVGAVDVGVRAGFFGDENESGHGEHRVRSDCGCDFCTDSCDLCLRTLVRLISWPPDFIVTRYVALVLIDSGGRLVLSLLFRGEIPGGF